MKSYCLILFTLLLLAACNPIPKPGDSSPTPQATSTIHEALDKAFTLKVGQSATIGDSGLVLTFAALLNDSRCPTSVSCVQAGEANISVVAQQANQAPLATEMSTNPPLRQNPIFYLTYAIHLDQLVPAPVNLNTTPDPASYEATFIIKPAATSTSTACPPRTDDPTGDLVAICTYIQSHKINVAPADPANYKIKRVEERTQNKRPVLWIFLNCCGLGDIAVIDKNSGDVISFQVGAH